MNKKKLFRKIDKKFLQQKKYKNYELYEDAKFVKFLKHYKIYNFSQIEQINKIRKEREEERKKIKEFVKQKEEMIKQKQQQPTKSQIFAYNNELTAYQIKLYQIVNELFDGIITNENIMFQPQIMEELKIYLPDLVKYFTFKYYQSLNLIKIEIRNLEKILEIKETLKQLQQQQI